MSAILTVQDVLREARFEPVKGHPQISVIQVKSTGLHRKAKTRAKRNSDQMTEKDWNKFEKDINDAFEQVP